MPRFTHLYIAGRVSRPPPDIRLGTAITKHSTKWRMTPYSIREDQTTLLTLEMDRSFTFRYTRRARAPTHTRTLLPGMNTPLPRFARHPVCKKVVPGRIALNVPMQSPNPEPRPFLPPVIRQVGIGKRICNMEVGHCPALGNSPRYYEHLAGSWVGK